MNITDSLYYKAKALARATKGFNQNKGPGNQPGQGNRATNEFQKKLRAWAQKNHEKKIIIEQKVNDSTAYAFDYYVPTEKTVVEVALSLNKSNTEFEKDIFKVLLARKAGLKVSKLVFIGKEGSEKRQSEPGPMAIREYVWKEHKLKIEVCDLK